MMRDLTDRPFGVNIAQAFVRDPEHRRVRDRPGRQVRDHVGRFADEVHRRPEGGRADRVPRRADAGRGAQGGRRRRRRARRRGRRGRRLQEPDAGVDDGAAAARAVAGSTCRSSPPAGSSTGRRWPPRSPSAPRACRWARGWCRPPSRRCTTTGSRRSSTPPRPTRCSSTTATPPRCGRCAPSAPRRSQHAEHNVFGDFGDAQALYFGGDMEAAIALVGSGRRAHRRGPPGRRHHRRHRRRVRRHDRPPLRLNAYLHEIGSQAVGPASIRPRTLHDVSWAGLDVVPDGDVRRRRRADVEPRTRRGARGQRLGRRSATFGQASVRHVTVPLAR